MKLGVVLDSGTISGERINKDQLSLVESLCSKKLSEICFFSPGDIENGYIANSNGDFSRVQIDGIDKVVIFSVDALSPDHSEEKVREDFKKYEDYLSQGFVSRFSNPLRSREKVDKRGLYENPVASRHLPSKIDFDSWGELYEDVISNGSNYVIKPKNGAEGLGVCLVDPSTIETMKPIGELEKYIIQEFVENKAETRLMIFGDEVVGSRLIRNRTYPWDKLQREGLSKISHSPTQEEESIALELHTQLGLDYSGIDFIDDGKGNRRLLEVNVICPGLIADYYPDRSIPLYDLNREFVDHITRDI